MVKPAPSLLLLHSHTASVLLLFESFLFTSFSMEEKSVSPYIPVFDTLVIVGSLLPLDTFHMYYGDVRGESSWGQA